MRKLTFSMPGMGGLRALEEILKIDPEAVILMVTAYATFETAISAWQSERVELMKNGESLEIAGYMLTFRGAAAEAGPNYTAERATIEVTRAGKAVTTLRPAKRFFPSQRMATTEAAIHTTGFADLYVVISDPNEAPGGPSDIRAGDPVSDAWIVRAYHNPLAPWLWIGCIFMVLGALVSLTDRRHRVGAPARARIPATGVAPAE